MKRGLVRSKGDKAFLLFARNRRGVIIITWIGVDNNNYRIIMVARTLILPTVVRTDESLLLPVVSVYLIKIDKEGSLHYLAVHSLATKYSEQ